MNHLDASVVTELLQVKDDGYMYHRESRNLEFKEQFNFAGLAEYYKDFAAFSNNNGGYLIFGVKNSPRIIQGLSTSSLEQFEKIDPEKISGDLLELFSPEIIWEMNTFKIGANSIGVIYIQENENKPVIAKKDEGDTIKNGEIYFRYAGRTQKVLFAELNNIIQQRINKTNLHWSNLMQKIARIKPENAAILDTEKGIIEKNESNVLVIDESLLKQIKFIKEGQFNQKTGTTTLKLVGEVQPVSSIEVTKVRRRNLLELYPFTYKELESEIKIVLPNAKPSEIHEVIKDNAIKADPTYSVFCFRSRTQEEKYESDAIPPTSVNSIYNRAAIEFIVKVLQT